MINNPWLKLPSEPPYVVAGDKDIVNTFNQRNKNANFHIHVDLLPEPYLGNPETASVILLSLNPGYHPNDRDFYSHPAHYQACLDNLAHRTAQFPFYLINPDYKEFSGYIWWNAKLKWLIRDVKLERVANGL